MHRRRFVLTSLAAAAVTAARRGTAATPELKFGHRQANMVSEPGPGVFDLAKRIHGLSGVELQVFFKGTSLWDKDTLAGYQRAAEKAGLAIPSLAGIWPPGVKTPLFQTTAEEHILKSIQAASALKASTILIATFDQNCPKMDQKESYEPIVALLQKVAAPAQDAGIVLGMETSNSPADDAKLIDLVNRPGLRDYYDLDNVERFKHIGQAVPGLETLTKTRIRQVHLKNEARLLEEDGRVNWAKAVEGLKRIGYAGWLVFESSHKGEEQCVEATQKNIAFVKQHWA